MATSNPTIHAPKTGYSTFEGDVLPVLINTIALPGMPCPLHLHNRADLDMIDQILVTGFRKFGIIPIELYGNDSGYGTILEITDCVYMSDGSCFLSVIGLHRFVVLETEMYNGYMIARIATIEDTLPMDIWEEIEIIYATHDLYMKTLQWIFSVPSAIQIEMEIVMGQFPSIEDSDGDYWWRSPNGPKWLWWLVAILPLRIDLKIMVLSCTNLLKRLRAINVSLNALFILMNSNVL